MITLYTIDECYLEISGTQYPVSAFKLDLTENGIPNIIITTDDNKYNRQASKETPPVKTPTPTELIATYDKFQKFCDKKEKAKFVFKATGLDENGKTDKQEITLIDWICTASGFAAIKSTGYSAFNVTLQHPVYLISSGPSNLMNIVFVDPEEYEEKMLETTDVYDGLITALNLYKESVSNASGGQSGVDVKAQAEQFQEAVNTIINVITSELETYPIDGSDFVNAFKFSMLDYATAFKESSIWNVLVGTICSEFALSLKPGYNKMYLSPLQPWGSVGYRINVSDIFNIQLPSSDLEPISGASCIVNEDIGANVSCVGGGGAGDVKDKTFFDGTKHEEYGENNKLVKGPIIRVGLPQWFIAGMRENCGSKGALRSPNANELALDQLIIDTVYTKYKQELKRVTDTVFLIKYKQAVNMVFTMRLFLNYNDTSFLPGKVCSIIDSNSKELIRGYMTGLLHVVDVVNKQAQTEVSMRYVRPTDFKVMGAIEKETPIWE